MTYALRKLIAFVFLGGIFWFIYQDLDNLEKPWFMHALGLITVAFAFFWLLIPMVVVRFRIRRRRAQNRERYDKWRAEQADRDPEPLPANSIRLDLEANERVYLHEKGTLYAAGDAISESVSRIGRPSDVAFPRFGSSCRFVQRTHCYITDRRVVFAGKGFVKAVPLSALKSFSGEPGGIVFNVAEKGTVVRLAFTFQNPLVTADVLRFALGVRRVAPVA